MLSLFEKFKSIFKPDAEDIDRLDRFEKEHRDRIKDCHEKARKQTKRNKNKTLSSNF